MGFSSLVFEGNFEAVLVVRLASAGGTAMGLKGREARPAVIICIDMKESKTPAPVLTYTHTEAHANRLPADRPDSRVARGQRFAEKAPATSNENAGPPRDQWALCADSAEGPRSRD